METINRPFILFHVEHFLWKQLTALFYRRKRRTETDVFWEGFSAERTGRARENRLVRPPPSRQFIIKPHKQKSTERLYLSPFCCHSTSILCPLCVRPQMSRTFRKCLALSSNLSANVSFKSANVSPCPLQLLSTNDLQMLIGILIDHAQIAYGFYSPHGVLRRRLSPRSGGHRKNRHAGKAGGYHALCFKTIKINSLNLVTQS